MVTAAIPTVSTPTPTPPKTTPTPTPPKEQGGIVARIKRAAQARSTPTVPTPPTETPTPPPVKKPVANEMYRVDNQGSFDEVIHFWGDKDREVGYEFKTKFGDTEGEHNYAITSKQPVAGQPGLWAYTTERKDIPSPWNPAEDEEEDFDQDEDYFRFVDMFIGVYSEGGTGTVGTNAIPIPETFPKFSGTPDTQNAIYGGFYTVKKNLDKYFLMLNQYFPDAVASLRDAIGETSEEARSRSGTLNSMASISLAVAAIREENPDDYSAYLASEAGFNDVWNRSMQYFLTQHDPEISILEFGKFVGQIERAFLPDVPVLKEALIRTTEIALDPIFIGLMMAMPPAAAAKKAQMLVRFSAEMALGGMAAEELGLPTIVGELAGPLAVAPLARRFVGGVAAGFTKSSIGESLSRARMNPRIGEPATEILKIRGELPNVGKVTGPNGSVIEEVALSQAETQAGRHVLKATGADGVELGTLQWREPGHIVDVVVQAEKQGIGSFLMEHTLADMAAAGKKVITGDLNSVGGVRLFNRFGAKFETIAGKKLSFEGALKEAQAGRGPLGTITMNEEMASRLVYQRAQRVVAGESGLPAVAGGAEAGPSVELMNSYIEANITRPEAQDILRRFSEAMSHIPGMRQLVKMFNITAIAKDPVIRGSFGYNGLRDIDDAARTISMASFRGKRVPFAQNHISQLWIPDVAPANRLERGVQIFRRTSGKGGEWVAQGDVFESVRLGEAKYINRLNTEQIDWINTSMDTLDLYSRMFGRITGAKIDKLPAWWPRFIQKTENKSFVSASGRKPPAAYKRVIESQEQAITELGFRYQPSLLNNMDNAIEAFQRVARDRVLADWFRKNRIILPGKPTLAKATAKEISPYTRGVIKATDLKQVNALIRSPSVTAPGLSKATSPFRTMNAIARLILTGTVDAGWGAIQLQTLAAVNPGLWAEAMGRGFFNMIVEPKQVYRFLANSPKAARYSLYGGNVGLETEFFQATRMSMPFTGGTGVANKALEAGTFPLRTFMHRMQTGFETTLLYGRVLAFDSLVGAATVAGKGTVGGALAVAAGGPVKALTGEAFHQEMFRLARFTDTLLGQPKLRGIITGGQAEIESAFVWFATRYTRSVFGTISYVVGKGYTPAQARLVLGKLMLGGSAMYAGFVAAIGKAQGLSPDEIQQKIITGLNPASGKEFYSMKMGDAWFGLGGAYRSFATFFAGLADKESWEFEEWESKLWDNPFVRGLRTRTSPTTGTLMDFLEGEDFLGYPIQISDAVDNPKAFADYILDNFSPITLDALMQDMKWQVHTARFAAEYFGMRTSPETRFEAETAVMNRISQQMYQVNYEDLEHNMIAQNIIREHPDVKQAAEGLFGLIRERERDKNFRLWDEASTELRGRYEESKLNLDDAISGINLYPIPEDALGVIPTTARMDGKVYRDEYRKLMAAEFHEVQGLRVGFGFQFEAEEAPEGSVDFIMEQFFELDLESYIDPDTLQPDWEAWFADGDAILEQLPEEWKEPADKFLHRRETSLRRDFSKKFEGIIEASGYFQVRENVASQLGFSLNALEDLAIASLTKQKRRASPGDVGREVDKVLNVLISRALGDEAPSLSKIRQLMRENNAELDVELLRQGFVTKVRSERAIEIGLEYMNETFPQMGYFAPSLSDDVYQALLH